MTVSKFDFLIGGATYKALRGIADSPNPANASIEQVREAWAKCATTTVCVWEPLNGVGHASIAIGNAVLGSPEPNSTENYASWFPGGAGVSGKEDALRDIEKAACSFEEDCLSEGDGNGGYRIPEHLIAIPRLSVEPMKSEWMRIQKNEAAYNLLKNNCSSIVARVLRHGMADTRSKFFSYWAHCVYWTPTDIKKLAWLLS